MRPAGDHRARRGRHAALITLAEQLPAPILAERLGLHHTRAAEWARVAGATYAVYLASRWGSRFSEQVSMHWTSIGRPPLEVPLPHLARPWA